MCWDDWNRAMGMEPGGLEESGACEESVNPVQSVTVIIIFFLVYAAFFPFQPLTLYLHFISKFLFHVSCVSVGHCAAKKLQIQLTPFFKKKNEISNLLERILRHMYRALPHCLASTTWLSALFMLSSFQFCIRYSY